MEERNASNPGLFQLYIDTTTLRWNRGFSPLSSPGLTPRSIARKTHFAKRMDTRVKPAYDVRSDRNYAPARERAPHVAGDRRCRIHRVERRRRFERGGVHRCRG